MDTSVAVGVGVGVGVGVAVAVGVLVGGVLMISVGVGVLLDRGGTGLGWDGSSSMMVNVSVSVAHPSHLMLSDANPDTLTLRSGSSDRLSLANIANPLLTVRPGRMVSGISGISKMPDDAGGSIVSLIVVVASAGWSSVAYTVLAPPFSEMELGSRNSVTSGIVTLGAGGCGSACPVLIIVPDDCATVTPLAGLPSASAPQQAARPWAVTAQVWKALAATAAKRA